MDLRDHLQCAYQLELLLTGDETEAVQQVLRNFGDPARMARTLWFEAMRAKIMSQRISLAITALLAVICLVVVGLVIRTVEHSQAEMLKLLEQNQAANQALLERLTQISALGPAQNSTIATSSKSQDWNPVSARLLLGQKNGPPAEGYIVRLSQMKSKSAGIKDFEMVAEERSGSDGVADLGLVAPGKYILCAMAYGAFERFSQSLTVLPGSEQTVDIVCPPTEIESVPVSVQADMPEDLRAQGLFLTVQLIAGPREFSGCPWRLGFNGVRAYNGEIVLAIAPDGRIGWTPQGPLPAPQGSAESFLGRRIQPLFTNQMGQELQTPIEHPLKVWETIYSLKALGVGRQFTAEDSSGSSLLLISEYQALPENKQYEYGGDDARISSRDLAALPKFTAAAGRENVWQIPVPAELWEQARKELKKLQTKLGAE